MRMLRRYGPRSVCLLLLCSLLALLPILIRRTWPKMRPGALLPTRSALHMSPEPLMASTSLESPKRILVTGRLQSVAGNL